MYRKKLYIKYFIYTSDMMAESATIRLLEAVKDDDMKACAEALENGANTRARYNNGITLIEMALLNKDFEMVKILVEHNANVNTISKHGEPMLATAIDYGDAETVKYLIEHGANVNAQNRHATLLTYAITTRRRSIAMLLLEKGANPNIYDGFESSPITAAVRQNDAEMLKALIKNGARPNFNDGENSFFYRIIIEGASDEVKKVLEDNFGKAYKNSDKHKARKFSPVKVEGISFANVIGLDNVKEELKRDIIYQIKNAELAKEFKVSMNGGMLLYGPPGTGKTLIVKAVAGEIGANLIEVKIHDVLDMWVGNISKAVKKIFEMARKNTPCFMLVTVLVRLAKVILKHLFHFVAGSLYYYPVEKAVLAIVEVGPSAVLYQRFEHFGIVLPDCSGNWRAFKAIVNIRVGSLFKQQHGYGAPPGCYRICEQGCMAVLGIDVCAMLNEVFHSFFVPIVYRSRKHRLAMLRYRVHVGVVLHENFDHFKIVVEQGHFNKGYAVVVPRPCISPVFERFRASLHVVVLYRFQKLYCS